MSCEQVAYIDQDQARDEEDGLTKVVLARRTDLCLTGELRSLDLLQTLQVINSEPLIIARLQSKIKPSDFWNWICTMHVLSVCNLVIM